MNYVENLLRAEVIECMYPLIPPILAVLLVFYSFREEELFRRKITDLCNARAKENKIDPIDLKDLLTHVVKSSIAIQNYRISLFSGFISFLIALHIWPDPYRYPVVVLVFVFFILFSWYWYTTLNSHRLDQIATYRPPKRVGKSAFRNYTYSQQLGRHQIYFNMFLILVILIGQLL